jgi:hypothetical protein
MADRNKSYFNTSLTEQDRHSFELRSVKLAGVLSHAIRIDYNRGNPCLNNRSGTVHAGHDLHISGTTLQRSPRTGRVVNGISLCMLNPEVFFRPHQTFWDTISDFARETIVAGGADFMCRADDDAPDLRSGVLASRSHRPAYGQIIRIPIGYDSRCFSHGQSILRLSPQNLPSNS